MSPVKPRSGPARILQLDVLRGIAIILVLGHHPAFDWENAGVFHGFARTWFNVGWTGVDLFFVLSGFLIGGLLFNELTDHHNLDVRRFLIRRGLKIWPSYYVYILALFLLLCARAPLTLMVNPPSKTTVRAAFNSIASNLLNIQNYLPTIRGHTWSLAVEEHFYLLLPFVLLAVTRRQRAETGRVKSIPAMPVIAVFLIVACTFGRFVVESRPEWNHFENVLTRTHLRLDGLFLGVLLAYYARYHAHWIERAGRYRYALLTVGLLMISPLAAYYRDTWTYGRSFGPTVLYLGYAMILCAVVSTPIGDGWLGKLLGSGPSRVIAYIGYYSYTIYLWHLDLAWAPLNWLKQTQAARALDPSLLWLIGMIAYIILATAAGVVTSLLIERPTLAIRDRIFPRRSLAVEADELPNPSAVGEAESPAVAIAEVRPGEGPARDRVDATIP